MVVGARESGTPGCESRLSNYHGLITAHTNTSATSAEGDVHSVTGTSQLPCIRE